MKVERTSYRQWPDAYRCTIGTVEIVVVTTIGPRIMSLRVAGGDNLLYEDRTDFRVGAWRLYGGHRLASAPESDASYIPDNEPCKAAIQGDRLVVWEPSTVTSADLLRGMDIGPVTGRPEFEIRHMLRNRGPKAWHGAAWAITCVNPGQVVIPQPRHRERFWSQPGQHYAGASSRQWRRAEDHFVVEPSGEKGKVGLCSEPGWLALVRPEVTFVVRGPGLMAGATYPDGGCNVEVYTCPHFLELETLGPLVTLEPGQELSHSERWQVVARPSEVFDWPLVDHFSQKAAVCVEGQPGPKC